MKRSTDYARKRSTITKLVVYLKNIGKKKDFHTTHTYYEVKDKSEAHRIIQTIHENDTINKVVYNSQPL